VAGGALVAVEPPQAPRASVAMTPMVRTRDHLVSDKERILRASSDTSSGSILPVARHGLRGQWLAHVSDRYPPTG
jgi:hypothetical protein